MSMRVWVRIQLLTLVLMPVGLAAGDFASATTPAKTEMPKTQPGELRQPPPPKTDGSEIQDFDLMPTPPTEPLTKEATKTYYFPYRQSLSPRLGFVFTTETDHRFEYLVGFNYLWPRYASPQAELGADLLSEYGGHLNFGVRHILFQRNYFRPFFLWGATHEVVADQRLATVTNIDNYYLRGAIGLEDTLILPTSVRVEIEGLVGLQKQLIKICLGYSWGF